MQKQPQARRSSGAQAIALDERAAVARFLFLQFLALILSAASALGLHILLGH